MQKNKTIKSSKTATYVYYQCRRLVKLKERINVDKKAKKRIK